MSPPNTPAELLLQKLAKNTPIGPAEQSRTIILAAHPDDETIGASALLGRVPGVTVVYLTDGAPRDAHFRSPHVSGSRELYACVRAEEAASALSYVGVSPSNMLFLSAVDQDAALQTRALVEEFCGIVKEFKPSVIVTHPYEGGHPDHDTAALVARMTVQLLPRDSTAPEILEMTSYHAQSEKRVTGQFLNPVPLLSGELQAPVRLELSPEERATKARMLSCYVSQWHVISEIPLEPEQLRVAPLYDFTQPPHPGLLWYEYLRWPMTGERWRELASQALAQCGQFACR
jgi:LmbE family N-acetylglucosaminyl deacetylase